MQYVLYEWKYDDDFGSSAERGANIRFAFLDPKRREVRIQCCDGGESPGPTWIPVFLGKDVLHFNASDKQANSNACRVHARYGKVGMACRLTFPAEQKPSGITGGTNVYWFYSVQGIFKLVNDLGTRQLQLECYDSFLKLWKERFDDDHLPVDIDVVRVITETDTEAVLTDESGGPGVREIAHAVGEREKDVESLVARPFCVDTPSVTTNVHLPSRITDWLNGACCAGMSSSSEEMPLCLSLIDALCDYCDASRTEWLSWETGFDTLFLCGVAKWLGNKLRSLEGVINERVENFKSREILNSGSILDCRKCITDLFHPAMVVLLSRWMGLVRDQTCHLVNERQLWQDSQPPAKMRKAAGFRADSNDEMFWNTIDETQQFRVPVLQTVLEFITGSLVSGKAMVLYSFVVPNENL